MSGADDRRQRPDSEIRADLLPVLVHLRDLDDVEGTDKHIMFVNVVAEICADRSRLAAELLLLRGQMEAATELAARAAGSRDQVRGASWREFTAILDALGGAR